MRKPYCLGFFAPYHSGSRLKSLGPFVRPEFLIDLSKDRLGQDLDSKTPFESRTAQRVAGMGSAKVVRTARGSGDRGDDRDRLPFGGKGVLIVPRSI